MNGEKTKKSFVFLKKNERNSNIKLNMKNELRTQ